MVVTYVSFLGFMPLLCHLLHLLPTRPQGRLKHNQWPHWPLTCCQTGETNHLGSPRFSFEEPLMESVTSNARPSLALPLWLKLLCLTALLIWTSNQSLSSFQQKLDGTRPWESLCQQSRPVLHKMQVWRHENHKPTRKKQLYVYNMYI